MDNNFISCYLHLDVLNHLEHGALDGRPPIFLGEQKN